MRWKEYYWIFIAGVLVALMAFLEKRVRIFYILSIVLFAIGFIKWIISERQTRRGRR